MPEQTLHDDALSGGAGSPLHGFRGHPAALETPGLPAALTIAISREAGSRGTVVAQRAGAKLGWQVYSQDLLEYICQEGTFRHDVIDHLPAAADAWSEGQLARLSKSPGFSSSDTILQLARMVLALGAQGEVILLGRGAGCILPARSTLHVRLVAPLADRVAYISQWMRLTEEEAAEHIAKTDQRRAEFIHSHFGRQPSDVHQYDLVINTSLLGEERSAELIVQAARVKAATLA